MIGKKRFPIIAFFLVLLICLSRFWVLADDFRTSSSKAIPSTSHLEEILENDEYIQKIHCDENGLDSIKLSLATFARQNNSEMKVDLLNGNKLLQTWNINCKLLKDNSDYILKLDKRQKGSKGKNYTLRITSDAAKGQGVTIRTNNKQGTTGLSHNKTNLKETLCYQLTYKLPLRAAWANRVNAFHLKIVIIIMLITLFGIPFLQKLSIEKAFIALWVPLCCLYLFSNTLFNVPDEIGHFCRAYEISCGYPVSKLSETGIGAGHELPFEGVKFNLLKENWQSFSENKDITTSDKETFIDITNQAVLSPLSYLPQATGVYIGRNFSKNIAFIAYSGRIANLLIITLAMFLTLKLLPGKVKPVMALIFMLPMNIHESVSLAPDGLVVALGALMMAFVVHISYVQENALTKKQLAFLYIMAIIISQMKIVYLPLLLCYLLIPAEKFGGKKNKILQLLLIACVAAFASLLWLWQASQFMGKIGRDSSMQLAGIMKHPLNYLLIVIKTFFNDGNVWILQMLGSNLGLLKIKTGEIIVLAYGIMLVLAYRDNWNSGRWAVKRNGIFAVIIVSIYLLIETSEYLYWTPLNDAVVRGMQGRYLIPLLLPLYYAINQIDDVIGQRSGTLSVNQFYIIVCVNMCACLSILFTCLAKT